MKEYFQESVLSTISTSRSKMENARYIPLGILLYIRERWVQTAVSDTRCSREERRRKEYTGIAWDCYEYENSLLSHTRKMYAQ